MATFKTSEVMKCGDCGSTVLFKEIVRTNGKVAKMAFDIEHPKFWLPRDKTFTVYQYRESAALIPHFDKCRQMVKWRRQGKKD